MFRGQPQRRRSGGDWFVETAAQPVLIPSRRDCQPRRRADRGIGIAIGEAQTLAGQSVEIRRTVRSAAIAMEVGVAEIVGQDEYEIRGRRALVAFHGPGPPWAVACVRRMLTSRGAGISVQPPNRGCRPLQYDVPPA